MKHDSETNLKKHIKGQNFTARLMFFSFFDLANNISSFVIV